MHPKRFFLAVFSLAAGCVLASSALAESPGEEFARRIAAADTARIPVSTIVRPSEKAKEPITVRDHAWIARFAADIGSTHLLRSSHFLAVSAPILFLDKAGNAAMRVELFWNAIRIDGSDFRLDDKTKSELFSLIGEQLALHAPLFGTSSDENTETSAPAAPAPRDESESAGSWSAVVDGIRGRLIVAPYRGEEDDRRWLALGQGWADGANVTRDRYAADELCGFLELETVFASGVRKDVSYSRDLCFSWQLTDENGQRAETFPVNIMAPFELPDWITLPGGAIVRLKVGGGSYSAAEGGMILGLGGYFWKVSSDKSKRYFLSATFFNSKPWRGPSTRPTMWQGVLTLPKVELPLRVQ